MQFELFHPFLCLRSAHSSSLFILVRITPQLASGLLYLRDDGEEPAGLAVALGSTFASLCSGGGSPEIRPCTGSIVSSPGAKALTSETVVPNVPIFARYFSLEDCRPTSGRAELPGDRPRAGSSMRSRVVVPPRSVSVLGFVEVEKEIIDAPPWPVPSGEQSWRERESKIT